MDSRQLYLILRARWKFALFVFACVLFLAAALTLLMPRVYTATASVVVEVKVDPVANAAYPQQLLASDIATQVDIIGSQPVAERVVKNLKLDQAPDFKELWVKDGSRGQLTEWLADYLLKQLILTPSKASNVILLSMNWRDAKTAAALANAFAQAYIETNIELKVNSAKQYTSLFDEQSRALRADLEVKQRRLADYQNSSGIVATDDKLDVENTRLAELSTQLVAIQTLRQESQSRQRQASGDTESLPEVLQSPVIANLKAELAKAEARRHEIGQTLGKNYPDYKDVESEVAGLRERIAQESARIAASLGNTAQVDVRRESDVKAALEAQKQRILGLCRHHRAAQPRCGNRAVGAEQPRERDPTDEYRAAFAGARAAAGIEPEVLAQHAARLRRRHRGCRGCRTALRDGGSARAPERGAPAAARHSADRQDSGRQCRRTAGVRAVPAAHDEAPDLVTMGAAPV
jgi:chain length determinant protein EpsF